VFFSYNLVSKEFNLVDVVVQILALFLLTFLFIVGLLIVEEYAAQNIFLYAHFFCFCITKTPKKP